MEIKMKKLLIISMKRAFLTAAAVTLLAAGISFAVDHVDHSAMHEMMMKEGGPKTDTRTELKMPEPMKVMHNKMMRQHLDNLSKITAALAANELDKAAEIAKENLGWNEAEEKMCAMFGEMAGDDDFMTLSKAMHTKADDLADAARAGNRDKALTELAQLIGKCNACHEKFRH